LLVLGAFMETVDIIALAHFDDGALGSIAKKQKRQVSRVVAERLEKLGLVKILNPLLSADEKRGTPPYVSAGEVEQPSFLQAVQAFQTKTSGQLESSIVNQLQSMIPTVEQSLPLSYTPAICSGGDTTVSLSEMVLRVSCGPKTKEQPKDTRLTTSKAKTKRG